MQNLFCFFKLLWFIKQTNWALFRRKGKRKNELNLINGDQAHADAVAIASSGRRRYSQPHSRAVTHPHAVPVSVSVRPGVIHFQHVSTPSYFSGSCEQIQGSTILRISTTHYSHFADLIHTCAHFLGLARQASLLPQETCYSGPFLAILSTSVAVTRAAEQLHKALLRYKCHQSCAITWLYYTALEI